MLLTPCEFLKLNKGKTARSGDTKFGLSLMVCDKSKALTTQTFSLVVKPNSIILAITIAVSRKWDLLQINISNAFLHSSLNERITVSQPAGFVDPLMPDHVSLPQKSL